MREILHKLRSSKKGTVTVEYALLLSCVVMSTSVVWKHLGQWVQGVVETAIQQFPAP